MGRRGIDRWICYVVGELTDAEQRKARGVLFPVASRVDALKTHTELLKMARQACSESTQDDFLDSLDRRARTKTLGPIFSAFTKEWYDMCVVGAGRRESEIESVKSVIDLHCTSPLRRSSCSASASPSCARSPRTTLTCAHPASGSVAHRLERWSRRPRTRRRASRYFRARSLRVASVVAAHPGPAALSCPVWHLVAEERAEQGLRQAGDQSMRTAHYEPRRTPYLRLQLRRPRRRPENDRHAAGPRRHAGHGAIHPCASRCDAGDRGGAVEWVAAGARSDCGGEPY